MVNLVFYGEGKEGRERPYRSGVAKYLPKDWNISLVTTLKETVERVKDERIKFHYLFDDEIFSRGELTDKEVEDIEQWLGFPLRMFKQYGKYIRDIKNNKKATKILNLIAKVIIAWRNYIEKHRIDILIGGMPTLVPNTTAEQVADRMGVKIMKYLPTFDQKFFTIYNKNYDIIEWNYENYNSSEIEPVYSAARAEFESRKKFLQASTADAIRWNLAIANPKVLRLKARQLKQIIKYNREHKHELYLESVYWQTKEYLKSVIRARTVPRLYQPIRKGEKYFFFPYHYLMDAQMLYREPYIDQCRLIENISHCLPYGTFLYTRAHPGYWGSDLPYNMVKKILSLPNVRFVTTEVLSREVIENAIAIFTINSTTGYEAVLLNKPLITFGHELYSRKGVSIVVRDFNELPNIIFKVMSDPNWGVDIERRKEFIYKIRKNAIPIEGRKTPKVDFYAIYEFTQNDYRRIAEALVKSYENYDRAM